MGNNPVIFVPSHRSYADFLLMSYITFHYDIEIPCIAAGMGLYYCLVFIIMKYTIVIYFFHVYKCYGSSYLLNKKFFINLLLINKALLSC